MSSKESDALMRSTMTVACAFVSRNAVAVDDLPGILKGIHQTLADTLGARPGAHVPPPTPAVPIDRSVTDEYIVCLEDGRRMRMLKRYLWNRYRLTPEAYRERWRLPGDYPMIAPALVSSDFVN
jgi:predicted transcriptional regulator